MVFVNGVGKKIKKKEREKEELLKKNNMKVGNGMPMRNKAVFGTLLLAASGFFAFPYFYVRKMQSENKNLTMSDEKISSTAIMRGGTLFCFCFLF